MIRIWLLLDVAIIALRASSKFRTYVPDTNKNVMSGDNVVFNCSIYTGGPAEHITWIIAANKRTLRSIGNAYWLSLPLTNLTLSAAGQYRCIAKKGSESDESNANLEVYAKPEVKLDSVRVLGDKDTIMCETIGSPIPQIEWYHNGMKVTENIRLSSIYELENKIYKDEMKRTSTLQIIGPEKGLNDGNYTCQAKNQNGEERRTLLVLFTEGPEVNAAQEQFVPEGVDVHLTCEGKKVLKQDTHVKTHWKFQGQRITNTSRYKEVNTRASHSMSLELMVRNVSVTDSGKYTCSVTNKKGTESGSITLNVVSNDIHPKVEIQEGKHIVEETKGASVALRCHVSFPLYMKEVQGFWLLNGTAKRRAEIGNRRTEKKDYISTGELSLNIANVSHQDEGIYVCMLNTTTGIFTAQVQLVIPKPTVYTTPGASDQGGRSTASLIATVLVISGGVLLTIIGLILVHRLRRQKPRLPYSYGSTNNTEFEYDVFVTFSGKDFEWVKKSLMPLLEEYGIKYCIHHRDFELGKGIYDNMAKSVYTSKNVLAIVSKNYMESKYCQSELEMALYRSTKRGDSSLIVVRIDAIDKEALPKTLRSRTFLDYHDKTERKTWEERLIKHLTNITTSGMHTREDQLWNER